MVINQAKRLCNFTKWFILCIYVHLCKQEIKTTNEDLECSCEEEDEDGDNVDDTTENESSDISENLRAKRKRVSITKKCRDRVVVKEIKRVLVPQVKVLIYFLS